MTGTRIISLEEFQAACSLVYSDVECEEWLNKEKGVILIVSKLADDDERFALEVCDDTGRRSQTGLAGVSSGGTWDLVVTRALEKDHHAASRQFLEELLQVNSDSGQKPTKPLDM